MVKIFHNSKLIISSVRAVYTLDILDFSKAMAICNFYEIHVCSLILYFSVSFSSWCNKLDIISLLEGYKVLNFLIDWNLTLLLLVCHPPMPNFELIEAIINSILSINILSRHFIRINDDFLLHILHYVIILRKLGILCYNFCIKLTAVQYILVHAYQIIRKEYFLHIKYMESNIMTFFLKTIFQKKSI